MQTNKSSFLSCFFFFLRDNQYYRAYIEGWWGASCLYICSLLSSFLIEFKCVFTGADVLFVISVYLLSIILSQNSFVQVNHCKVHMVESPSRRVRSIFILGSQILYTFAILVFNFRIPSDGDNHKLLKKFFPYIGRVLILIGLVSIKSSGEFLVWITDILTVITSVLSTVTVVLLIKQVSINYIKNLTLE